MTLPQVGNSIYIYIALYFHFWFFDSINIYEMDNIYFERFNTFLIAIFEFLNIYYIIYS